MRLIHWILVPPATVATVLFAVSNRQQTEVQLWPLPYAIDLPVYIIALGPLVIGFLIGAVAMWYSGMRRRMRRRTREKAATANLPDRPANAPS
jgi:lipopolysaccharide assembly protein A